MIVKFASFPISFVAEPLELLGTLTPHQTASAKFVLASLPSTGRLLRNSSIFSHVFMASSPVKSTMFYY